MLKQKVKNKYTMVFVVFKFEKSSNNKTLLSKEHFKNQGKL